MAPMTAPYILFLLGLLPVIQVTSGALNLYKRPKGFVYNPSSGACEPPITLSFFIDNTCPDSKLAFPTMLKVADRLGPHKVKLVTHLFSLPYHRNSHVIAKGAHAISAFTNDDKNCNMTHTKEVYDWFQVVFDNLHRLSTSATSEKTDDQVLDILAPLAQSVSGITLARFTSDVHKGVYDIDARLDWKYSCTRGVYKAPSFMINDVIVDVPESRSVDEWVEHIESLL